MVKGACDFPVRNYEVSGRLCFLPSGCSVLMFKKMNDEWSSFLNPESKFNGPMLSFNLTKTRTVAHKKKKSSLYSRYYSATCNEWRGPFPRLSTWLHSSEET